MGGYLEGCSGQESMVHNLIVYMLHTYICTCTFTHTCTCMFIHVHVCINGVQYRLQITLGGLKGVLRVNLIIHIQMYVTIILVSIQTLHACGMICDVCTTSHVRSD